MRYLRPGMFLAWLAFGLLARAQTPVFDYTSFDSNTGLGLQGGARYENGRIRLAEGTAREVGAVWFPLKRFLAGGFSTTFEFQASGGSPAGEGVAFVIQNNALPGLGSAGASMGYGGVRNSLAVEVDLAESPGIQDFQAGHVTVLTAGTAFNTPDHSAALVSPTLYPLLLDGQVHRIQIRYVPGTLTCTVDGDADSAIAILIDLATMPILSQGQAWFGLAASATSPGHAIEILNWSFALEPTPLSVTLTAPFDGASYQAPAKVFFTAEVTPAAEPIARIEFYQGARKLGELTNAPYQFGWSNVPPGNFVVTALARDISGGFSVSQPLSLWVHPPQPPIGIHFAVGANQTRYAMPFSTPAGILPQRYWNNSYPFTNGIGQSINLRDGLGVGAAVDLFCDFQRLSEEPNVNPAQSGDYLLMKSFGVEEPAPPGSPTNSTVQVTQVPYTIYDVLVYSDGDNGGMDAITQFRLGTNTLYLRDAPGSTFAGIYAEGGSTLDQGIATSAGNYVRFNGLTSNGFNLTISTRAIAGAIQRGAVSAIQIVPSIFDASQPPRLTRGPYLQSGTPTSVLVRWRTNRPVNSRLRYGLTGASLNQAVIDLTETSEHIVQLTNLTPNTRYFYSIGTTETNFTTGNSYFFYTSPTQAKPTRVWVLGDSGTANTNAMAVRDAYYSFNGTRYTDVWLMLGDNAYNSGTDGEFQSAVFNMYPQTLRQSVLWSVVGNHETAQSHSPPLTIPYFLIHSFPQQGEAGGVPSGTERYYSFDYGDLHFVCLDSMTSSRANDGIMANWLRSDLQANTKLWTIALFHHPPYTKGSHDSDDPSGPNGPDFELVEMRANIVPILEEYGVDMVLSGHSHCYERSFLLRGHYGHSTTLTPDMVLDSGDGRVNGSGAYVKQTSGANPNAGTIYIVAGSAGQATFGTLNHPAMYVSLLRLGSLILDINTNRLDAQFMRDIGEPDDYFTLIKQSGTQAIRLEPFRVTAIALRGGSVHLTWNSRLGSSYAVEFATQPVPGAWRVIRSGIMATETRTSCIHDPPPDTPVGYYRVVRQDP